MERAIRYLRDSFFAARSFTDLADLNAQADQWCEGIASDRPCPEDASITVREAFERERASLLALPEHRWPAEERLEVRVPKTPYVRFDLNDYSVPHEHVRTTLTVFADAATVRIVDGVSEVARHARSWSRGEQVECEAHISDLVAAKAAATEHRGQHRLGAAAPSATALLEQAAARGTPIKALVRDLNQLLDESGAAELEIACAEAIERAVPHANAVRLALERRREARGAPPPLPVRLPADERVRGIVVRTGALGDYDHINPGTDADTGESDDDAPDSTTPEH